MNQKEAGMADTFYSIRQVADRLGVRWYRVKYAHQAGHVQEPLRVGNTRFYADADIRRLEDYFSMRPGRAIGMTEIKRPAGETGQVLDGSNQFPKPVRLNIASRA
jgi:hypothetical protein